MQTLFLALQRDKSIKRQMELLWQLSIHSHAMSTTYLTQRLECSPPTLLKDVAILNMELNDYIQIASHELGKISFTKLDDTPVEHLTTLLKKSTLAYQIINGILHNKRWSPQQAALELGVSRTSLLRTIWHMNDNMTRFQVAIGTKNNINFIGKEEHIRVFLFFFHAEFGDSGIISKNIDTEAKQIIDALRSPRLHVSHFRVAIWLSIVKLRWKDKHFVSLTDDLEENIADKENYLLFEQTVAKYFRKLSLSSKLPKDEAIWTYFMVLHCISYSDDFSAANDYHVIPAYSRHEKPHMIEEIQQFLGGVFDEEYFQNGMLEKMIALLVNKRLLTKISPSFEFVSPRVKELIQDTHSELYQLWREKLVAVGEGSPLKFSFIEDMAITLTILHTSVMKQGPKKPLRVLFAFQGEAGFDDYIAHMTKSMLTEQIHADYFLERAITKEAVEKKKADLVVSNYDLHLVGKVSCPIIRLSNVPTLTDWAIVRDAIARLME